MPHSPRSLLPALSSAVRLTVAALIASALVVSGASPSSAVEVPPAPPVVDAPAAAPVVDAPPASASPTADETVEADVTDGASIEGDGDVDRRVAGDQCERAARIGTTATTTSTSPAIGRRSMAPTSSTRSSRVRTRSSSPRPSARPSSPSGGTIGRTSRRRVRSRSPTGRPCRAWTLSSRLAVLSRASCRVSAARRYRMPTSRRTRTTTATSNTGAMLRPTRAVRSRSLGCQQGTYTVQFTPPSGSAIFRRVVERQARPVLRRHVQRRGR